MLVSLWRLWPALHVTSSLFRTNFADTCVRCRFLAFDTDCRKACNRAGLSIPNGVSVRAMAKLLVRPRVGVCNWSMESGEPKGNFDFSKIWSVSSAIRNAVGVGVHPAMVTQNYLFLCDAKTFEDVHLRVAQDQPEILLCRHPLYMHEYLTHPPLQKLRVLMREHQGPFVKSLVWTRVV